MKFLRTLFLLLPLALLEVGCQGTSSNNLDANGQPVSAVPWNKPESWEQNGQLGTALGR